MFSSLWRRPRARYAVSLPAKVSRPRLEALEDRLPPALCAGAFVSPAPVGLVTRLGPPPPPATGAAKPITVTVPESSSPTVIDLGGVFARMGGLQHQDGLKLSVLGNTNSGLVTTSLSEAALTLSYTPKKWGTATITVGATDVDRVSVEQTLLVQVRPVSPPLTVVVSPVWPSPSVTLTPGTYR
jgi:hypothetical protein